MPGCDIQCERQYCLGQRAGSVAKWPRLLTAMDLCAALSSRGAWLLLHKILIKCTLQRVEKFAATEK